MNISLVQIILLAVVQGLAELLPVSSSAHVIVAEKLLGLDPSAPAMTFLLVMLHTGTMFAVILYFWPKWRALWRLDGEGSLGFRRFARAVIIATAATGIVGLGLKKLIEKTVLAGAGKAEIEELFKNLPLIATSLAAAGVLIFLTGKLSSRWRADGTLTDKRALAVGLVQGLCLPFRGFSRSGATISVGLAQGLPRELAEVFSFALAVVLTPPVIALELYRLLKATAAAGNGGGVTGAAMPVAILLPGLAGMVFSFLAGLVALRWLSRWLEAGRWHYFGIYCLVAAAGVAVLAWQLGPTG